MRLRRRIGIGEMICPLLAVVFSLGLASCGSSREDPPDTPLAEALAELSGGGEHGSLGIGWADPELVRRAGLGADLIADALGSNADTVIEHAAPLRRSFGFDPLKAERLTSVGGSYAFGLRLDGVPGGGVSEALARAGGRSQRTGELELVDIGAWAVMPEPLLRLGVRLGARDAFGPDVTVLAISAMDRARLLGRGERMLEQPIYRAAADCLGDVVAARMIPERLLLSTEFGVDLIALGIRADRREVLCVLGGTSERADETAHALEGSLASNAREPRTGQSIAELIAEADVASSRYEGVEVVRAELTPAPGQPPGFLFASVARGSVVELIVGRDAAKRALIAMSRCSGSSPSTAVESVA